MILWVVQKCSPSDLSFLAPWLICAKIILSKVPKDFSYAENLMSKVLLTWSYVPKYWAYASFYIFTMFSRFLVVSISFLILAFYQRHVVTWLRFLRHCSIHIWCISTILSSSKKFCTCLLRFCIVAPTSWVNPYCLRMDYCCPNKRICCALL